MPPPAEYIQRAGEAKRQAQQARNPEERAAVEAIANLWVRLAEQRVTGRSERAISTLDVRRRAIGATAERRYGHAMKLKPVYQWSDRAQTALILSSVVFGMASIPLSMIIMKVFIRWLMSW